jgi:hypothetical protein
MADCFEDLKTDGKMIIGPRFWDSCGKGANAGESDNGTFAHNRLADKGIWRLKQLVLQKTPCHTPML